MSENTFIEGCSGITDPAEILNWYRNLYYKEPENSEHRIMAEAINKILPEYATLKHNLK